MLTLVLGNNYLMMFLGWEGVGFCSYLLIGYYFHKKSAGRRRQEGLHRQPHRRLRLHRRACCSCSSTFGTFNFSQRRSGLVTGPARRGPLRRDLGHHPAALRRRHRQERPDPALRLAARRHGGPDAGVGPDPRGHHGHRRRLHGHPAAASSSPAPRRPWSWWRFVGVTTALLAALMGLVQRDIKKVLAYSTISQLGYMFTALGVARLLGRHLPPDDPRLLQGAALPRRRQRDPRHAPRAGHAEHGRPAQVHAR